jgi:hypothetical protein
MGVDITLYRARIGCFLFRGRNKIHKNIFGDEKINDTSTSYCSIALIIVLLIIGCVEQNPGPATRYNCNICQKSLNNIHHFIAHIKVHACDRNVVFKCPENNCLFRTQSISKLQKHLYERQRENTKFTSKTGESTIECTVVHCKEKFPTLRCLYLHSKAHIKHDKIDLKCPKKECKYIFKTVRAFECHCSKFHNCFKTDTEVNINTNVDDNYFMDTTIDNHDDTHFEHSNTNTEAQVKDKYLFPTRDIVSQIAKFYLKLESQYLLPSSVVQAIADDLKSLSAVIHNNLLSGLKNILIEVKKLSRKEVKEITKRCLALNSLYFTHHNNMSGNMHNHDYLGTSHYRFNYYKNNFNYVAPKEHIINRVDKKEFFCHYIPPTETLQVLLQNKSFQDLVMKTNTDKKQINSCELRDYKDGEIYKRLYTNDYDDNSTQIIDLILFQDECEPCNPLGSGRTIHKILAFYFMIGNIPAEQRNNLDNIQLLLLCKSKYVKQFGIYEVLKPVITELKNLEINGLTINEIQYKIRIRFILGDNLGSHFIGGFLCNFNTDFFCRYCNVTKHKFLENPIVVESIRTPAEYNQILMDIDNESLEHKHGIKSASVFNEFHNYHVCNPGLPPCLFHDLFEGIVAFDIPLYIKFMIKKLKWFDYIKINRRLDHFTYLASDRNNKCVFVRLNAKKLHGSASQNRNFLRLLPLFLHGLVKNLNHPVYQQILLLKKLCEIVCSPRISAFQLFNLKDMINDYLYERINLFPKKKLRPKHHYLLHYPLLIKKFGPLIRLHTLRCESKNKVIKTIANKCNNTINITKTISLKHQLLFAYNSSNPNFNLRIRFQAESYNVIPQNVLSQLNSMGACDVIPVQALEINGISYKNELYLPIYYESQDIIFGKITRMYFDKNDCSFFHVISYKCDFDPLYCLYKINSTGISSSIMKFTDFIDYYPLPAYQLGDFKYLCLKHSIVQYNDNI